MKGLFFSFEGIEAAGKSTQIDIISNMLNNQGLNNIVVRDPGSTVLGQKIRQLLLDDKSITNINYMSELLLYVSARVEMLEKIIRPALTKGKIVLCDRYIDSSIAYQAYGTDRPYQEVLAINNIACNSLWPEKTFFLKIPLDVSKKRIKARGKELDRMELKNEDFHKRVYKGFEELSEMFDERYVVIDAIQEPEIVTQQTYIIMKEIIDKCRQ